MAIQEQTDGSASPFATSGRARPRVLLTTEGTYPHYTGGVSSWCDRLMRGAENVDFVVWALMMNPFIKKQFDFPSNVTGFVEVPLWGVEQPAEYTREIPSAQVFRASRRTREADVEQHFLPLFDNFLEQTTAVLFSPDDFAQSLADMHAYFREFEYRRTWRSRAVWESFKQKLMSGTGYTLPPPPERDPQMLDEPPLPSLSDMRDSFLYLVRGGRNDRDEVPDGEDIPLVAEAIEGLRWLYRLLQTLNVEVPAADVTHSAAAAFCAVPCILAKVERGTPFLLTEHGVYLREQYLNIERRRYPYNLKRFLIDFVSAIAQTSYHLADQVSPVCRFNARWEIAYGTPAERIRVIYNGVDPDVYSPRAVARRDVPTVIQVGRIDPLKDQVTLLRVADTVRREIPNVEFHHYGNVSDDEYEEEVRDLHRELKLQNTVRFMGETKHVAEAYGTADISLMTSISEAFPFGVVESLMCGKPVVSTNVGGVPEALNGTGATAPARDVEGLSRAVIDMLRLPAEEREALSRRARERAVEHFTLKQFVGEYEQSYFDLVSRAVPVLAPEAERQSAEEAWAEEWAARAAEDVIVEQRPSSPVEEPLPSEPPRIQEPVAEQPTVEPVAAPIPDVEAMPPVVEPGEEPGEAITLSDLVDALSAADPFVRARAIARARSMPGVVGVLVDALADSSPLVRREAVRALARVGGADAAYALSTVATSDPSAEVRTEAVSALGQLVEADGTEQGTGA